MAYELKEILKREEGVEYKELYTTIADKLEKIYLGALGDYPWFKGVKFKVVEKMNQLEIHGSLFVEDTFEFTEIDDFLLTNPYKIPEKRRDHLNSLLYHFGECFKLNPDDYFLGRKTGISFDYREVFTADNDQPLRKIGRLRSEYISYANEYYLRELNSSNVYRHIREHLKDLTVEFNYCAIDISYKQSFDITFEEETKELETIQSLLQLLNTIYRLSKHKSVLFSYTD